MTETIKAVATDKVVYTALNCVDDMPKKVAVLAVVDGQHGFYECYRMNIPDENYREVFWLENECYEVARKDVIGWVHYPEYEAEYEDAAKKICRYLSENYWHGLEDWQIDEIERKPACDDGHLIIVK